MGDLSKRLLLLMVFDTRLKNLVVEDGGPLSGLETAIDFS